MSDGWIKLHRKIQNCFIWEDKPYDKARAWIDLLMLAMHQDKKLIIDGNVVVIGRGSFMTSRLKLADRWGWSLKKVDSYFKMLENEEMVTTEKTNKGTTITIVNYEEYQILGTTEDITNAIPEDTTEEIAEDTQNKNIKNDKNNICTSDTKKAQQEELEKNFKIIYESYPKKVGKAKGFDLYKGWLKGRDISGSKIKLTNKQIWSAIAKYKQQIDENGTEKKYVKQFDTFMNKAILDYVGDEE